MIKIKNSFPAERNLLLGLQFLSDFGDQITQALLALCILDITQSTTKVGLTYFMTTFGYFLFTLIGGIVGDKFSRGKVLFFTDISRGLVVLFLIIALKEKSIIFIYASSFFLAILGAFHGPVKMSIWAESIPAQKLEKYNNLSELSLHASTIIGPLIASFFIARNYISTGFALDAATFIICAYFFRNFFRSSRASEPRRENELFKGLLLVSRNLEFRKYVAYDAMHMLGFGAFNATFLVLAQRDYGWTKIEYSYHLSIVAAITAFIAFFGIAPHVKRKGARFELVGGAILSSVAFLAAIRLESFPLSSILIGICSGISVLTVAITRTKVQLLAKNFYPNFLASIMAARAVLIKGSTLLSITICLLIDEAIDLNDALALFVIPILLSCFILIPIKKISVAKLLPKAKHDIN